MTRAGALVLAAALAAVTAAAAPVAHFAPGTVPGTLRYQVVSAGGGATGDISGTLGRLTNLEVLAGPVLEQEVVWRGAEPVATTVLTWILRARTPGPIAVGRTRVQLGNTQLFTNAVSGSALAGGHRGGGVQLLTQLSSVRVRVGEPLVVHFLVAAPPQAIGEGWEVQASFPDSWSERLPAEAGPEGGPGRWPPGLLPLGGWLVIPARSGRLEIPSAVARAADWSADSDTPASPGLTATSQPVSVEVAKLPSAPEPFFGAVGTLVFSRRLLAKGTQAGDMTAVEIDVHGTGNLPLLEPPPLQLPAGIRSFAPEESHEWKASPRGLVGWRRWRIPIEAASPGAYQLPAVTFCTFRPGKSYATQTLPALTLAVRPPDVTARTTPTSRPHPEPTRWPAAAIVAAAFLAGAGTVLAARAWRARGPRRPLRADDAAAELRRMQLAVERWVRSRWGVAASSGPAGWTAAGCPAADAEEAASLIRACERLRVSPGLADPADAVPGLRLRVRRLTATGEAPADRLEG